MDTQNTICHICMFHRGISQNDSGNDQHACSQGCTYLLWILLRKFDKLIHFQCINIYIHQFETLLYKATYKTHVVALIQEMKTYEQYITNKWYNK